MAADPSVHTNLTAQEIFNKIYDPSNNWIQTNGGGGGGGSSNVNLNEVGGAAFGLGQTTKAGSLPVTLASDQGALSVTGTFWQTTQPVSIAGTITTNPPANASTNINEVGGSLLALGQTTKSGSLPITLASDQGNLPINITQFFGTNISTGTGGSGAGIPRVTVANDSTVLTKGVGSSASGVTSVANSVTSVNILASNVNRRMATFYNDDTLGTGATVKLKLGSTASATSFTIPIAPGGYYELPKPVYTGAIDAIATAATGNLRITELT